MQMKKMWMVVLMMFAFVTVKPALALAAFDSTSTGADGALEVKLENSATAVYVNGQYVGTSLPLPENGVFNFTTVNVEAGRTLTFVKNELNTPVTILASGDVTINGTVSVNGSGRNGGPGGYNGGYGGPKGKVGRRGEGPGGASGGNMSSTNLGSTGGAGGGFGGVGSNYLTSVIGGQIYGNSRNVPLVGGSGGGGGGGVASYAGGNGGGGGGALLIASSGTINVNGTINAIGSGGTRAADYADGYYSYEPCYSAGAGGGGSGGAIRLIAERVVGNGSINATGGAGNHQIYSSTSYGDSCQRNLSGSGGHGRILIEAGTISQNIVTTPQASLGPPLALFPLDVPTLKILSVGGVTIPASAKGDMNTPDIWLPYNTTNPVPVQVQTINVPSGATITLKAHPVEGSITSATTVLSGSTASLNINLSTQFPSVITAYATYELTAALGGPLLSDGEQIAKVRVETVLGGESRVVYITASGREVLNVM